MSTLTLRTILAIGHLMALTLLFTPSEVNCASYFQTLRMPGTTLATGIFYRIDLKSSGLLSWSFKTATGGNHMQVVYGKAVKEFEPGARYWIDSQWMFVASEKKGYYTMLNKNETHAVIVALPNAPSPSGKWVGLIMNKDKDPDYLEGGKYRANALWRVVAEPGKPDDDLTSTNYYYNIYNAFYEGKKNGTGLLSWSTKEVSEGKKFVQVYDDEDSSKYWNNADYLWKITPSSEWTFSAEIDSFNTTQLSAGKVGYFANNKYLVKNVAYKNPNQDKSYTYTFQKTYVRRNWYKFTFDDPLKFFAFIRIQAKTLVVECNELNFYAKLEEYKEGKPITTEELIMFNYNLTFELFNGKCEKIHANYLHFNRLSLPFEARVGIKGLTEVMTSDTRVVERYFVYGNAVKAALQRVTDFKKAKFLNVDLRYAFYNMTGTFDVNIGYKKNWLKYRLGCDKFDSTKPEGGEGEFDTSQGSYPDA